MREGCVKESTAVAVLRAWSDQPYLLRIARTALLPCFRVHRNGGEGAACLVVAEEEEEEEEEEEKLETKFCIEPNRGDGDSGIVWGRIGCCAALKDGAKHPPLRRACVR
ncbi:hypothetical protein PLESTB_000577500 [Pleodorina starrii]|uniref:Uncharacterized protein n=1 Tax=Pleodorina starrii TaxID=330485 RepID=A0A9W6BHS9_9CHLO|nr:hypothetical protein PLESTB_000577500 [Pleodorina starrii]